MTVDILSIVVGIVAGTLFAMVFMLMIENAQLRKQLETFYELMTNAMNNNKGNE